MINFYINSNPQTLQVSPSIQGKATGGKITYMNVTPSTGNPFPFYQVEFGGLVETDRTSNPGLRYDTLVVPANLSSISIPIHFRDGGQVGPIITLTIYNPDGTLTSLNSALISISYVFVPQ